MTLLKDIYFKGIVFLWVARFSKQKKNICLECLHLKPMTFRILCGKMYVTPSCTITKPVGFYFKKLLKVITNTERLTKKNPTAHENLYLSWDFFLICIFMTTLRAINNPFLKSIILTTLNTGSRNYSQRTKVLSKI